MIRLHKVESGKWKVSARRIVRGWIVLSEEIVRERIVLSHYYASSNTKRVTGFRPVGLNGESGPYVYLTKREAAHALVSYTHLFPYEK